MYNIRSTTPMTAIDGHVDIDFADRSGWTENMGATILPIMIGDDQCGPFVALELRRADQRADAAVVRSCARERQLAHLGAGHHEHGP